VRRVGYNVITTTANRYDHLYRAARQTAVAALDRL
jgi:hypothetical protein